MGKYNVIPAKAGIQPSYKSTFCAADASRWIPAFAGMTVFCALLLFATSAAAQTLSQAIQKLEAEGKLPVLDRSEHLAGTDADHNGIRDDIDAYIAKQDYTESQRKAVEQLARGFQEAVTLDFQSLDKLAFKNAAWRIGQKNSNAINCIFDKFKDTQTANTVSGNYEKITANTKIRTYSYIHYNNALSGSVFSLPRGDTCEK